ncbi:MAG: tRNA dihydrouridine synthase DusB [Bdellovibrionaceae bacterium]|nr:tRNA dihydrouridine synthase DusB [Pseudobdellovibrionaceae bacterium]NUM57642.1 tRNA dihydrouridine synthase DusB [Pseudobdellovibrionaceae bacterium]
MNTKLLLEHLKKNPFVLAPMAGITDHSFRTLMRQLDSSVVVSELISANGIEYENQKTLDMMGFDEIQRPIAIQLFGDDPEVIAKAAQFVESKNVDFIDLNFGCPVPKVTKKGAGSAMLKDLEMFAKVLRAVVKAVNLPVTIKIRTGWDQNTRNSVEVCNIAFNEGITWVAIHGRTRSQNYEGLADWNYIAEVKSHVKIPVLGNGDIHTPEQAVQRLKQSGCDGVLIGRGALKNPFIFSEALQLWQGNSTLESFPLQKNYTWVLTELNSLYSRHSSEQIREIQLKKFAAWFSAGFPGSAKFRKDIFQLEGPEHILEASINYFNLLEKTLQEDTSQEKFLMGGHG